MDAACTCPEGEDPELCTSCIANLPAPEDYLNHMQALFAQHYALHGNATKAAKDAGYSAKTAHVQGYVLLKQPKIQRALARERAELRARHENTHEHIRDELWKLHEITQAKGQHGVAKAVLELIGKSVAMFADRTELSGPGGKPIELDTVGIKQALIDKLTRQKPQGGTP